MSPKLSTLDEDVEGAIRELSSVGECKRTRLSDSSGDVYTSLATSEYKEGFIMMNVGAKFTTGEKLQGVTYGYLLKVKRGWESPTADIFYDWCDSSTADSAEFARGVLDSGQYDRLFLRGDLWGISGFEFVGDFPSQERVSALRRLAVNLKRSHTRLAHAAMVLRPSGFGLEPPTQPLAEVEKFRAALADVLRMGEQLNLGECLCPNDPTTDLLMSGQRRLSHEEELAELLRRTRITKPRSR